MIVGSSSTSSGAKHACLWEDGSIIDLGTIDGDYSVAFAINNSRQIVGQSYAAPDGNPIRAFLWESGTMHNLGGTTREALGINSPGQIVGDFGGDVLYENGAQVDLGFSGKGTDISDREEIVGAYNTASGYPQLFLPCKWILPGVTFRR